MSAKSQRQPLYFQFPGRSVFCVAGGWNIFSVEFEYMLSRLPSCAVRIGIGSETESKHAYQRHNSAQCYQDKPYYNRIRQQLRPRYERSYHRSTEHQIPDLRCRSSAQRTLRHSSQPCYSENQAAGLEGHDLLFLQNSSPDKPIQSVVQLLQSLGLE